MSDDNTNKLMQKAAMQAGEWYLATDKELIKLRAHAKELCHQYNQLGANEAGKRKALFRQLLPNAKGLFAEANFYCDYGYNIFSKAPVFLNHNVTLLDGADITFGKNVLIGPNTVITTTSHHMDTDKRRVGYCRSLPITIEDDVWIGANVTIMPGVTIGKAAVIGAGVVVRSDVVANEVIKLNC